MPKTRTNPYYTVGMSKTRASRTTTSGRYSDDRFNNTPERHFDYYEGRQTDDWYYSDYED